MQAHRFRVPVQILLMSVIIIVTIRLWLDKAPVAAGSLPSTEASNGRTFFSFERELWMESCGAKLVKSEPERYLNNPVIPRGEANAHDSHRVSSTSILPESDRLRAWYGSLREGAPWYEHFVAYAESEDGLQWTKPNLDLVRSDTNLILEGPGALIVIPDGEGGYKAAAQFWRDDVRQPGAEPGATFEIVSSRDGYRWNFSKSPATEIRHFEIYGFYTRNGLWWVLGQGVSPYFVLPDGRPHRRVMYGFYSSDGETATPFPRPLFHYPIHPTFPDATLQHHVGAAIWDRDRVLIGFAGQLWPSGFGVTVRASIGLLYSYDGLEWKEPFPETPFLVPGPEGSWDDGMLFQVQRPVNRGDRTWFYYTGGDSGNTWDTHEALGLAFLRRDGLAFYTPDTTSASLITIPLQRTREETTLYANSQGSLTIQLLDKYLSPISDAVRVEQDSVRNTVLDLSKIDPDEVFRVSFQLDNKARLYTFTLGSQQYGRRSVDQWE